MRRLTLTCALLAATALSAGPLGAAPLSIEDLATQALAGEPAGEAELVPLTEAELADERGGFLTPLGEINFAATLTTIVNGQTALQTTLTLTEQGLQQQVSSFLPASLTGIAQVNPASTPGTNALNNTGLPVTVNQPVTTQQSALNTGADALTPAITAINQATSGLTQGLAQPGNPADDAPSLQDAGGVSSIASVLPAGPAQQVVGGLAGSIDGLVDSVTGYVPDTPQTQTQEVASQTAVYTPEVLPQTSAELQAAAAAAGIHLGGLQGNGLVLPGEGGATAILHSVTNNALTNTVINTASNVDVQLHTEINLVMPGLENLQSEIAEAALTSSLHDAIGRALSGF